MNRFTDDDGDRASTIADLMARHARIGTWRADSPTAVEWSPELADLFGATSGGELPFSEGEFERLHSALETTFAGGDPVSLELSVDQPGDSRCLRLTGEVANQDGTVVVIGTAQDFTHTSVSERALAESAHLLKEAQRVARLGIYRLELTTGLWTSSDILDSIFGIVGDPPERPVSRWTEVVHPDDRQEMLDYLQEHVIGRGQPFDREYRIQRPSDGEVCWVHGLGELVLNTKGQATTMVGTIRDITTAKQAEAHRLELERQLLHSQKLESLGLLAGGIAHDFNNLLMAVVGNLDLALMTLPDDAPAADCIEQALDAARYSTELTRQMLAYSGRGNFVIEDLDLNTLVGDNSKLLRASVGKNIAIEVQLAHELPLVLADAGQMQQVVLNLITNAAEAIGSAGGVIQVGTGCCQCDNWDLLESRIEERPPTGPYVWLEVTDDGCGMDKATEDRLFDPFFTTKVSGRGLGMSAVLGIVRGHGGAITLHSALQVGSSLRVYLPVSNSAQPEPGKMKATSSAAPRPTEPSTGTILVVDDEVVVRGLLRRMLERLGHTVLEAEDGVEGVEVFTEHHPVIAGVVLDLTMPRMGGVEALGRLREIDPGVRVILASGYDRDDALDRFTDSGPTTFIHKPFRFNQLKSLLAEVLSDPE